MKYLYDDLVMIRVIKLGQLKWVGHVMRMERTRPAKQVKEAKPN